MTQDTTFHISTCTGSVRALFLRQLAGLWYLSSHRRVGPPMYRNATKHPVNYAPRRARLQRLALRREVGGAHAQAPAAGPGQHVVAGGVPGGAGGAGRAPQSRARGQAVHAEQQRIVHHRDAPAPRAQVQAPAPVGQPGTLNLLGGASPLKQLFWASRAWVGLEIWQGEVQGTVPGRAHRLAVLQNRCRGSGYVRLLPGTHMKPDTYRPECTFVSCTPMTWELTARARHV